MILHALAIAAISITISKTAFFKPIREYAPTKFLRKLLDCPYCLSHWLAITIVITHPWVDCFDFVINTMSLVAMSAIASLFILQYLDQLEG